MTTVTQEPPLKLPFRILVIAAHPDDIEFGMAGSIAHWSAQGAEVIYCLVTDGSAGSNDPDIDRQTLIARREEEQRRAAQVVGVKTVHFLGYQDGVVEPSLALRRDLTRLIRQTKPDRVIIQDPTTIYLENFYINHPDHRAVGEAALYAVFPSAETRPIFPELLAEGLEPHHVDELYLNFSMQPTIFVDISQTIERKIESLLCHASQVGPEAGQEVRKWNAEDGQKYGVGFCETFRKMDFTRNRAAQTDTQETAVEA